MYYCCLALASRSCSVFRIGVVEGGDSDDHVDQNAKNSFEVIALAVTEEVADHQNGENEYDGIKDLKVEVELMAETP